MGLVVHDLRSGQRFAWRSFTNESLSTIKVLILVACLRKSQEDAKEFTDEQHNRARRMIQSSDNAATDSLLAWVDTTNVQRAAVDLGLKATRSGRVRRRLVGLQHDHARRPRDPARRGRLGDGGDPRGSPRLHPPPHGRCRAGAAVGRRRPATLDGVYTETKNGWGPLPDGYRLNSIGRVVGQGRSHTMAILTRSPQGFRYGKETISGLSKIVHEALALPL